MYFRTKREHDFYLLLNPTSDEVFQECDQNSNAFNSPFNIESQISVLNSRLQQGVSSKDLFLEIQNLIPKTFQLEDFTRIYFFIGTCFQKDNDLDVALLYYVFALQLSTNSVIYEIFYKLYQEIFHKE